MIKSEQIPDEVVDKFYMDGFWLGTPDEARAAIAAALNAWPRVEPHKVLTVRDNGEGYDLKQIGIILPLPQEARDE